MAAKHGHGHAEAMALLTRALATAKAADPEALRARLTADDRIETDAAAVLKGTA